MVGLTSGYDENSEIRKLLGHNRIVNWRSQRLEKVTTNELVQSKNSEINKAS